MKGWMFTKSTQAPVKVALPHGEMELHPTGKVLSRQEYFELTRALGLVEARSVMSHQGLEVGTAPGRSAERHLDADVTRFAQALAA
jgi:hypothetical protein